MGIHQFNTGPFKAVFVLIAFGLLAWIAGEAHFTFAKPDEQERSSLIEKALKDAQHTFSSKEKELIDDTQRLVTAIEPILSDSETDRIFNRISNVTEFWGITVFREMEPYIWSGNPVAMVPDASSDSLYVTLSRSGYVIYYVCQRTLFDENDTRFDIVTTRLIRRTGASPVLLTEQIDITQDWIKDQVYPVNFRFFDVEQASDPAQRIALNTVSVDSVGYVTASIADFPALEREWHRSMILFRYTMLFIGLLLLTGLLVLIIRIQPQKYQPYLFGLLTALLWLSLIFIEIPFPRLLSPDDRLELIYLAIFARNAVFTSILLLIFIQHIRIQIPTGNIFAYLSFGVNSVLTGLSGAWILLETHNVIMATETGLLSLSVNPDWNSWIVYLSTSAMAGPFVCLLYNLIRKQLLNLKSKTYVLILIFVVGFVLGFISLIIWSESAVSTGLWFRFLLSALLIAFISGIDKPGWFSAGRLPAPRLIALTVFAVVALLLPTFFDAEILKENQEMVRMSVNYTETNEEQASTISRVLLQNLAVDPGIQQIQTVDAYPSFPIHAAAQFRSRVMKWVEPEWNSYTILAFLLDGRLNVITDYGSQPAFSDRFSSSFYEEVRLFIRQSLKKPFARLPIIESDPRFKGFPVFVKGLQSIPSDFPSQPSWLVTFVLVEGTSFGRPIHDALIFHQRDRDNWNKIILTEYQDGQKTRSTAATRAPIYPVHHTLSDTDFLESDEKIRFRNLKEPAAVRQLLYKHDNRTFIISTVRDQTLLNFIFSGFRFFVAILILSLGMFQIWIFFRKRSGYQPDKNKQRLHDRILDSYLLATLLFLVALAFVTELIVSRQNLTIAEQELSRNLTLLENRIYQVDAGETDIGAFDNQDIDIILYDFGRLSGTTAPEIFRLQLMSEFMPYQAFDRIYNQNVSTVFLQSSIGNLPVLMGFRALFEDNQVRRVISIPAYTRSAAYEEEFLQTTTYLIAFYIIIFVFFTGGAWVLSRRLTQPLSAFQSGLQQISSGNLDTMIPVSSEDEIGELAVAYNQMVRDLKHVRQELATAEREAAWSEMARQIAHEIKNPLTPMKLSIQHLQRQLLSGEKTMEELRPNIQRLTELLVTQIESLNQISSDFSKFAKPLNGVFERTDIQKLIGSAIRLFDHQENVQLTFHEPPSPVHVNVIPEEINRVFINLIKNAIEASTDVAVISLRVEIRERHVHIYITDNGCGIQVQDADRIFMPNFSTKSSGTGLGLAICRKIMDAHKGTITFSSSDGNGTTFELVLPIAK